MSLEFGEYCSKVLVISIIPFKMDPLFSDVSCFSSKPRPHHFFEVASICLLGFETTELIHLMTAYAK